MTGSKHFMSYSSALCIAAARSILATTGLLDNDHARMFSFYKIDTSQLPFSCLHRLWYCHKAHTVVQRRVWSQALNGSSKNIVRETEREQEKGISRRSLVGQACRLFVTKPVGPRTRVNVTHIQRLIPHYQHSRPGLSACHIAAL